MEAGKVKVVPLKVPEHRLKGYPLYYITNNKEYILYFSNTNHLIQYDIGTDKYTILASLPSSLYAINYVYALNTANNVMYIGAQFLVALDLNSLKWNVLCNNSIMDDKAAKKMHLNILSTQPIHQISSVFCLNAFNEIHFLVRQSQKHIKYDIIGNNFGSLNDIRFSSWKHSIL